MTKETSLIGLAGVGEKVAEKLAILGLQTIGDLLYYYPHRYEDFSNPRSIDQLTLGDGQIIKARIVDIKNDLSPRQRMKITTATVADDTGQLKIVWFNQPFLIQVLKPGTTWLFAGKVEQDYRRNVTMVSPVVERDAKVVPVYSETTGLTSKVIRKLVSQIRPYMHDLPEFLPEAVRLDNRLMTEAEALEALHFPESIEQISAGKKRLAFNEIFLLLARIQLTKSELAISISPRCQARIEEVKNFTSSLPFQLTDSQRVSSWEIIKDLERNTPMNRLLEGDVGSGKTIVGLIAALVVIRSGYRAVWMAPTEILARQHYESSQKFLAGLGINCGLLTSSTTNQITRQLDNYELVIGTQAIIQDKVHFTKLGLIIVDEQHRFGVKQRNLLTQNQKMTPHFLAMTATPIPRTLALTIYGDLDISILQSVPTGRLPIISRLVDPAHRQEAYDLIRSQIKAGRQAFVVCPLIESSESVELEDKRAATAEYEKLRKQVFPDLRIGLLHGKLKSNEKEAIMRRFADGEIDVLVSTAVIEVGIDIPNATVMMLESADRFGLAQLHQFRGRVGRGEHQSYCFVFTDTQSPQAVERLRAFVDTTSGFELAELDLELRGPGQLAGLIQSGLSDLKLASLSDIALIQQAKQVLATIASTDKQSYTKILEMVRARAEITHLG
jgi:ATP-dependent DNA helicase RecG